ncbi:MAG: hemolysin-type calcium-binding repeat family protein [Rhodobacteraceae bacterium]|uniref:calcium-binding protein n=1 Tax=Cypionkella sp. TaxID=2811411 RepID=UPI001324F1D1|nr:hypothetical protein [Cypionkella sp.]KAF0174828.1 MAG: hemolysin-type calcium-binding repeat family protein [Paracoccaceae bacterium]
MLIEATSQTTEGHVYILSGNDDLHVGSDVTIRSTLTDAVTTWAGAHVFTIDGTIIGQDDCINTIGCDDAQTVIINAGAKLISGGDGAVSDADGVILDGIGSTMTNAGDIHSYGSAASLFVRDAGTTTVSNSGTMYGRVSGVWHKFGIGTLIFNNSGTVESPNNAFWGGASVDIVTNTGTLRGGVDLGAGNDVLNNKGGTVTGLILGGEGDDRFVLSTTAETIDGGAGFDTLDLSSYTSAVLIDLNVAANNRGAAALRDSFSGIEAIIGTTRADVLRGDAGDNLFNGLGGSDNLSGGAGADTLEGGAGKDVLTGGDGADVFLFTSSKGMNDQITDFVAGVDQIRLEGSAFGYGLATGAISAAYFVEQTSLTVTDRAQHFIFRSTDSSLWYDADGSGKRAAVLIADLQDGATMTAADIWLI